MNIVVAGASGRMGRMLIEAVSAADDMKLTGALDVPGSPGIGEEIVRGVRISSDIAASLKGANALIDFTRPEGTMVHLEACLAAGTAFVIGTTGLDAAQKQRITEASRRIPVVLAPNMAIGVNAVFKLAEVAAGILGDDYEVEIIEAHHRHKVDAPSGTALRIGEVIAAKLGRSLDETAVHGREGVTGERDRKSIGFHAIRGGDIVGEHTVIFAGEGERVEISVRSGSRATYAQGALRACRFIAGRGPGLFDMQDVLGLR